MAGLVFQKIEGFPISYTWLWLENQQLSHHCGQLS